MFGTVLLIAAAVGIGWLMWRHENPPELYGCPLCSDRVKDVPAHLDTCHDVRPMLCVACGRQIDGPERGAHWRLWHQPRTVGPEDRPDWR